MRHNLLRGRLILRSTLGLAALSVVLLTPPSSLFIEAAQQSNLQLSASQSNQSPAQTPSSADALAEAQQLSLTVVKLFNEKKYAEALPLAKRALLLRENALGPDHDMVQSAMLNTPLPGNMVNRISCWSDYWGSMKSEPGRKTPALLFFWTNLLTSLLC